MKITQVVNKLDQFGDTEAKKIDDSGNVVFHTEGNLDSISEVENLFEYVDMLPSASMTITGNRMNALVIVKIDCKEFTQIPPYLEDDWTRSSEDRFP